MKRKADSIPARPVSEEELSRHLDDLFADQPQKRGGDAGRIKDTLLQAAQHGFDHANGSPLQHSLSHLARLIDRKIYHLRDRGLIPVDLSEEALQAWGRQVEAWGKRVNQQQRGRRRRR